MRARTHPSVTGMFLAIVFAGPLFVAMLAIGALSGGSHAVAPDLARAATYLTILFIAAIPGSVIATLPVLLGGAAMARLGRTNVGLRHPAAWALAGALMAGGWLPFLADGPRDAETLFAFPATGAVCALIVRARTRWPD